MLHRGRVLVVLIALAAAAGPARADDGDAAFRFVSGAAQRARRAIALGPAAGIGGAYETSASEADAPISFGLALRLFKVRVVPTPAEIQAMIEQRVKARTAERLKAMAVHGQPPPDAAELERIGREIFQEVKAEILGEQGRPARTLEKPRLAVTLEGARLLRADAWQVRAVAALGIWKVTLGPAITGHLGAADGLLLGGELGVHLTPWKGVRSPVVDLYLRAELGVTDAVSEADLITLGTRFVLDLI